ncbi:hypothetical protein GWI33_008936 [Rhynchophorus ferrugineus]|uniref:Uncharacterized protein n=1 Tax=Rhynchophorus ferrugineus TaxID=354439 RepID=A0A834IG36_RHYFE|nr:hypothetical protein GWI33_008936 [Rhynchophorus ferrugineus]
MASHQERTAIEKGAAMILKGPASKCPKILKSIGEVFFEKCAKHPNKIFQIEADTGVEETYAQAKLRSIRLALVLNKYVKPGDTTLICSENTIDNVIPILATLYIGGIASSIDPKDTVDDVVHAMSYIKPKVVFTEPRSSKLLKEAYAKLQKDDPSLCVKFITIGGSEENDGENLLIDDLTIEHHEENDFNIHPQDPFDTAVYVFTSGTTSKPKPVALSHFGVLHGFKCLVDEIDNCKPDVLIHFASLYWISAILLTGITIVNGGTKIVAPKIPALNLLELIEKYKVTFAFMSNTYTYSLTNLPLDIIAKHNTSSLYSIIIGGSTMSPAQLQKIRQILPHTKVTVGYGSSECAAVSAFDLIDLKAYEKKILASGKVVADVQVKIVDVETGNLAPVNTTGEILVKNPYMMKGYHPQVVVPSSTFDSDGFIRTGDLGYYDEDEYLFVTDRLTDTFKYTTYQVCPCEIERVLYEHPAVEECAVFGVHHEIDRNHPAASIVLKKGATATKEELLEFINSQVSVKNQIRAGLDIVEKLPKSSTGKILRKALAKAFIQKYDLWFYGMDRSKL